MIDIGDECVHCGRSTAFGQGMFVNRVPASTTRETDGARVEVQGYACADCLSPDEDERCRCSTCDGMCEDYLDYDQQDWLCLACREGGHKGATLEPPKQDQP